MSHETDHAQDVVRDEDAQRFELPVPHGVARLDYVRRRDRLALVHTEVPPEDEGQGYASALVRAALAHARREGLMVIPRCAFVRAYLRKHPEYADLVDER